jgi:serine/threonine protein kinase/ketosteroid isomerase-like protein
LPEPGTLIEGKYEILGKIREGGMGSIYKVRHKLLDEVRVIKVMRPEMVADEELRLRFVEEAKTATRLKHPNIGTIHDFALDEDGTAYLVMEFIDGINLIDLKVAHGLPSLALTLEIAHQALLALGYLHRKNVVHRDIAPDNLMLTHDEEGRPQTKLIDLGIAKATDREQKMTSTGVFLGKLKYASPELFGSLLPGEKLDGRSDLYSLGVMLYELLTGVRPIGGETPAELLRAHLFVPPTPFEDTDPQGRVPQELRVILLKALQKKREDRFATAEEFDREILALRRRYAVPEDLQGTAAIVSRVRQTGEHAAVTITPSAQGRLDRQFGFQATPHPSRPSAMEMPTLAAETKEPTIDPQTAPAATVLRSSARPARASAVRSRRALPIGVAAAVIVGAIVAAALLLGRRGEPQKVPVSPLISPEPAAAVPALEPTAVPEAVPTAVAIAPPEPTAALPTAPPTSLETTAARREVEQVRARAARSHSAAEKARAAELAADAYQRGVAKEREARTLFQRGSFAAAQAAFELAAQLFEAAQMRAESARREARQPSPVAVAAVAPPTGRPEPTRAPLVVFTEAPSPVTPSGSAKAGVSEQDRIREVLRDYERAHNTLDVDLYARVFPSFVAQQRQSLDRAWHGLKSQHVELEIRQIEVKGSQAIVHSLQRLVAVPQAGVEQRDAREILIRLEKRGDSWVITDRT